MKRSMKYGFACILATMLSSVLAIGSAYAEEPKLPISGTYTYPAGEKPAPHQMGPEKSPSEVEPLSSSQCPLYYFCMWNNTNYNGIIWSVTGRNNEWRYVGSSFNDEAGSIWNRRTNSTWVDADYPAGSRYVCIGGQGWSYSDLTNNKWPQNGSGAAWSISSYWLAESDYENCKNQPQFT